jgi:hypothetical protein
MWFWSVNEMIELVYGMPTPQIGLNLNERIRAGSRFKRFMYFVLFDVRCFRVALKMSSRTPG